MTAKRLLALPDDGMRRELVRGQLKMMTPAGFRHGEIALEIGARLRNHVRSRNLGIVCAAETGFKLESDPDMVRAPDVAFIRKDRIPPPGFTGYPDFAPDLAVEVLSPGDSFSSIEEKMRCWLEHGSDEVWVIDPQNRRAIVYRKDSTILDLSCEDAIEGGSLLPGFQMQVGELFRE